MSPSNFAGLLGLMLLLLLGSQSEAQDFPSPAARIPYVSVDAPASFTRADTARAVRRLFRSRRGGGIGWLALGTTSMLTSILPAQQSTSAGVWTPGVVAGSAFMLIGLNKRIQFRPENERQVLRELAATGRLAPNIARRLRGKSKVTKGLSSDYNPLLAEGIAPKVPIVPADSARPSIAGRPNDLPSGALLTTAPGQAMAQTDTLRAISRLYERRRRGGVFWGSLGLSAGLTMVISMVSEGSSIRGDVGKLAAVTAVSTAVPFAIGLANFTAYSEQRQLETERSYRAGQPLPKKIRARLKKKDLQPYD